MNFMIALQVKIQQNPCFASTSQINGYRQELSIQITLNPNPQKSSFCTAALSLDAVLTMYFQQNVVIGGVSVDQLVFPTFQYLDKVIKISYNVGSLAVLDAIMDQEVISYKVVLGEDLTTTEGTFQLGLYSQMDSTACWSDIALNYSGRAGNEFFVIQATPVECEFPATATNFKAIIHGNGFEEIIVPSAAAGPLGLYSFETGHYEHMLTRRFYQLCQTASCIKFVQNITEYYDYNSPFELEISYEYQGIQRIIKESITTIFTPESAASIAAISPLMGVMIFDQFIFKYTINGVVPQIAPADYLITRIILNINGKNMYLQNNKTFEQFFENDFQMYHSTLIPDIVQKYHTYTYIIETVFYKDGLVTAQTFISNTGFVSCMLQFNLYIQYQSIYAEQVPIYKDVCISSKTYAPFDLELLIFNDGIKETVTRFVATKLRDFTLNQSLIEFSCEDNTNPTTCEQQLTLFRNTIQQDKRAGYSVVSSNRFAFAEFVYLDVYDTIYILIASYCALILVVGIIVIVISQVRKKSEEK